MANNFSIKVNGKVYSGVLKETDVKNVPTGKFAYDLRHSDNDDMIPSTLESKVKVNRFGTFIATGEIPFMEVDESGTKYSSIEDFSYLC